MRIGIDVRATQLGGGVRGIGRYIFDLVEGVTRLAPEHEYVLIAFPDKPIPSPLMNLPPCCRTVTLPTRLLGPYTWHQKPRYVWRVRYLKAQVEQRRSLAALAARLRLDVLHQPCPYETEYFPGSRPRCRLVQTYYDAIPMIFRQQFLERWPEAQRLVYDLETADCRRADAVVAISQSARQDAIRYARIAPRKLHVIYPSVSEEFLPVADTERLTDCFRRVGVRPPYFLFCSAPEYTKNLPGILQAFARFQADWPQKYQLVLVSRMTGDLERQIREAGVPGEQLLITDFVSDGDLVSLYSGATALLSPSLYEGFGLPAGQAMRAGTPVVASDRSAQPEVVGDAGLLVDPEDVGAIAGALRRLAGEPSLRAELSARGRERAGRFGWRRQAQAMLDVYQGAEAPDGGRVA